MICFVSLREHNKVDDVYKNIGISVGDRLMMDIGYDLAVKNVFIRNVTGVHIEYYDGTDNVMIRCECSEGYLHGKYIFYKKDGTEALVSTYNRGELVL
jgi:hypothetical protein